MKAATAAVLLALGLAVGLLLVPTRAEGAGGGKLVVIDAGGSAWLCNGRDVWRWTGSGWELTTRYLVQ